jgi:hypothetical protein
VSYFPVYWRYNFIRLVWKGKLLALGKVVKKGRTTGLVECDIVDENEQLVARASSTYMAISGDQTKIELSRPDSKFSSSRKRCTEKIKIQMFGYKLGGMTVN